MVRSSGARILAMYLGVPSGAMCSKAAVGMLRAVPLPFPAPFARLFAFAVFSALPAFAIVGCKGKGTAEAADAGDHRTSASLTDEQQGKVLARVGDTTITLGDYVAALEHMDQFDRLRYQDPKRRTELLNEMIVTKLLAQEAREKGYDKDPRVQEELRAVLRDAMLKDVRKGAPTPADIPVSDARAYYEAHRASYRDPERRRISAIVLPTAPAADAVLEQVKKGVTAAQWGELVRSKSVDPSAKAAVPVDLAGDLGMISPPGDPHDDNPRVPEDVRVAAFEIPKVGDVAPRVVKALGKFYVVRLTVKNDPQDRSFAESERTIRIKLSQEKVRAKESELLNELRAKFPVQVDDATLATVTVDVPDGGWPAANIADASRD